MHLTGPANWALPGWLDRILPRLAIEARSVSPSTVSTVSTHVRKSLGSGDGCSP
jgi:hypothetical protein